MRGTLGGRAAALFLTLWLGGLVRDVDAFLSAAVVRHRSAGWSPPLWQLASGKDGPFGDDDRLEGAFMNLDGDGTGEGDEGAQDGLSDEEVFQKAAELLEIRDLTSEPRKLELPAKPFAVKNGTTPGYGFEMKVRALRGEFSPEGESDTERDVNLLAALGNFPGKYTFTAVGKGDNFEEEVIAIVADTSGDSVLPDDVVVTERMGGKFKSVQVSAWVKEALVIPAVFEALQAHPQVKMQF